MVFLTSWSSDSALYLVPTSILYSNPYSSFRDPRLRKQHPWNPCLASQVGLSALVCASFPVPLNTPLLHPACMRVCLVTQSCLTFCNSMDCSLPGSSIFGILQARVLEWVAIPFSRESF